MGDKMDRTEKKQEEVREAMEYTKAKNDEIDKAIEILRSKSLEYGNIEIIKQTENDILTIKEQLKYSPTFSHSPDKYKEFYDETLTRINNMINIYTTAIEEKKEKEISLAFVTLKEKAREYDNPNVLNQVDDYIRKLKKIMLNGPDEYNITDKSTELYDVLLNNIKNMINLLDNSIEEKRKNKLH